MWNWFRKLAAKDRTDFIKERIDQRLGKMGNDEAERFVSVLDQTLIGEGVAATGLLLQNTPVMLDAFAQFCIRIGSSTKGYKNEKYDGTYAEAVMNWVFADPHLLDRDHATNAGFAHLKQLRGSIEEFERIANLPETKEFNAKQKELANEAANNQQAITEAADALAIRDQNNIPGAGPNAGEEFVRVVKMVQRMVELNNSGHERIITPDQQKALQKYEGYISAAKTQAKIKFENNILEQINKSKTLPDLLRRIKNYQVEKLTTPDRPKEQAEFAVEYGSTPDLAQQGVFDGKNAKEVKEWIHADPSLLRHGPEIQQALQQIHDIYEKPAVQRRNAELLKEAEPLAEAAIAPAVAEGLRGGEYTQNVEQGENGTTRHIYRKTTGDYQGEAIAEEYFDNQTNPPVKKTRWKITGDLANLVNTRKNQATKPIRQKMFLDSPTNGDGSSMPFRDFAKKMREFGAFIPNWDYNKTKEQAIAEEGNTEKQDEIWPNVTLSDRAKEGIKFLKEMGSLRVFRIDIDNFHATTEVLSGIPYDFKYYKIDPNNPKPLRENDLPVSNGYVYQDVKKWPTISSSGIGNRTPFCVRAPGTSLGGSYAGANKGDDGVYRLGNVFNACPHYYFVEDSGRPLQNNTGFSCLIHNGSHQANMSQDGSQVVISKEEAGRVGPLLRDGGVPISFDCELRKAMQTDEDVLQNLLNQIRNGELTQIKGFQEARPQLYEAHKGTIIPLAIDKWLATSNINPSFYSQAKAILGHDFQQYKDRLLQASIIGFDSMIRQTPSGSGYKDAKTALGRDLPVETKQVWLQLVKPSVVQNIRDNRMTVEQARFILGDDINDVIEEMKGAKIDHWTKFISQTQDMDPYLRLKEVVKDIGFIPAKVFLAAMPSVGQRLMARPLSYESYAQFAISDVEGEELEKCKAALYRAGRKGWLNLISHTQKGTAPATFKAQCTQLGIFRFDPIVRTAYNKKLQDLGEYVLAIDRARNDLPRDTGAYPQHFNSLQNYWQYELNQAESMDELRNLVPQVPEELKQNMAQTIRDRISQLQRPAVQPSPVRQAPVRQQPPVAVNPVAPRNQPNRPGLPPR